MIFHKKYKIPIYFGELHIFINDSIKEVDEKFKLGLGEKYYKGYDAIVGTFHTQKGYTRYFIVIDAPVETKILVHESKHVVNSIFIDRQIELDRHNDEPECYLLGWVFEKIQLTYKEYKK